MSLLFKLLALSTLKITITENLSSKIERNFTPDKNFKIAIVNVDFLSLYIVSVDWFCHEPKSTCIDIINHYRFFAINNVNGDKNLLKIAYSGYCMDDHIPDYDVFMYRKLILEFPTGILDEEGKELSFFKASTLTFEEHFLPNELKLPPLFDDWRQSRLALLPSERAFIKKMHSNEVSFECIEPQHKVVLFDFGDCQDVQGKILAVSSDMVYFEDVDLADAKRKELKDFLNDIRFVFYGVDSGGKEVEGYGLTKGSTIQNYEGVGINKKVYLPRDLNVGDLKGVRVEHNFKNICDLVFDQDSRGKELDDVKSKTSEKAALPPFKIGEECATPEEIIDGNYNLSDNFKVGSILNFTCDLSYFLRPAKFTSNCTLIEGIAEWSPQNWPKCIKRVHACIPNPCKNKAQCVDSGTNDLNDFQCKCSGLFYGKLCEKNSCSSNLCQNNSPCVPTDNRGAFMCDCSNDYYGKLCEIHACNPNLCQHESICIPTNEQEGFKCKCSEGYYGDLCENLKIPDKPKPKNPDKTLQYCGPQGTSYVLTKTANFLCNCKKGYSAEINQKCSINREKHFPNLNPTNCVLSYFPNGQFLHKGDFLKVGEVISVKCAETFSQTVHKVRCESSGLLSVSPVKICIKENKIDKQTISSTKGSVWYYVLYSAIIIIIMLSLGSIVYLIYKKRYRQ